jgi:hypothetical protein
MTSKEWYLLHSNLEKVAYILQNFYIITPTWNTLTTVEKHVFLAGHAHCNQII